MFLSYYLMKIIFIQYIMPGVIEALPYWHNGELWVTFTYFLKLSVPSMYYWLCFFYMIFYAGSNALAELLRFKDRMFFKDWWNARSLGEY